jgi:hypothetical protein
MKPIKCIKKPIQIEAMQLSRESVPAIQEWITSHGGQAISSADQVCVIVKTLEGAMSAHRGDWILRGVRGEFYPCAGDIFTETYTEVLA